jgi:hypothetical protein
MKALYFYGDLYLGQQWVEEPMPEMLFPISKNLSGMIGNYDHSDPFPTPANGKEFVRLSFKLEDRGRKHLIYYLKGFED